MLVNLYVNDFVYDYCKELRKYSVLNSFPSIFDNQTIFKLEIPLEEYPRLQCLSNFGDYYNRRELSTLKIILRKLKSEKYVLIEEVFYDEEERSFVTKLPKSRNKNSRTCYVLKKR